MIRGDGWAVAPDPDALGEGYGSDTEDAQYLAIGAEGGYVGRDGLVPEGEGSPRGPGFPGRPGS